MLVEANARYRAGGYPIPTYNGVVNVGINISNLATDDQIEAELISRARCRIASSGCFDLSMVDIIDLSNVRYQRQDHVYPGKDNYLIPSDVVKYADEGRI